MNIVNDSIIHKLKKAIDKAEVTETIKKLISIPSYPGIACQETGVAGFIGDFFAGAGIQAELTEVLEGRCNVIAKLPGSGAGRSLLLTGHMDTVPPYDMPDACSPKIVEGKIFGRGAVDMKGPLACMMHAILALKNSGVTLNGDLLFAGVIGEETDCQGTMDLIARKIKTDGAIVGEPSNMTLSIGHRGLEWFEFKFSGTGIHGGSKHEGHSAIDHAVAFINEVNKRILSELPKRTHPVIAHSDMNIGLIQGGTQPSSVAGECVVQIDRRWVPSESYESVVNEYQCVLDGLQKTLHGFNGQMRSMTDNRKNKHRYVCMPLDTPKGHAMTNSAYKAIELATGQGPQITAFDAWSDGGLLSGYGHIPTVIFAPGKLKNAHSAHEHIETKDLADSVLAYALMSALFCGVSGP